MGTTKRLFEAEQIRQREINSLEDDDYFYEKYMREKEWEEEFYKERQDEVKKIKNYE